MVYGRKECFFASWSDKNAKKATKTCKLAVKEAACAKIASEVKDAVFKFIELINTLPNIETTGREDVGSAIQQLVKECPFETSEKQAEEWFDEIRNF